MVVRYSNGYEDINTGQVGLYKVSNTSTSTVYIDPNGVVDDTTDLATWFSNNQTQLVYELATPVTYQLTGEEVSLLVGKNNIFANTGDISVTVTEPTYFVNPGYFTSKPLIRVYGTGTFTVGDVVVTIAAHTTPYIDIDSELQDCYYESTNMNSYVSFSGNDFPVLKPGSNYVLMGSGITKLEVTPRWWVL